MFHTDQFYFSVFDVFNINYEAEKTSLRVPTLKVIRSGESDTLQCSVQETTSSCAEEQSVYWLKHGSGESYEGIIYTHVDISVKEALRLVFPHRAAATLFLRADSDLMMLEFTTVLWLHVERFSLGMEQKSM